LYVFDPSFLLPFRFFAHVPSRGPFSRPAELFHRFFFFPTYRVVFLFRYRVVIKRGSGVDAGVDDNSPVLSS
jgi:hypothetical protein